MVRDPAARKIFDSPHISMFRSILDKNFAFPSWSIRSSIKGMAYRSGVVMLLTFLKSMQRHTEPSGFLTGTIGLDQGHKDGLTMPYYNRDNTSTRSCSFHVGANRYGTDLMGVCPPVLIPWSISCALPVVSHITSPNC